MRLNLQLLSIFLLALYPSNRALCALMSINGKEWELWTDNHYSVIVAKVTSIQSDHQANGTTHDVVLEPLVTLAGSLDPTSRHSLEMGVAVGGVGTSIREAPRSGATILVVIRSPNFVAPEICTFMPGQSALVVVNGLGDPRITETIEKLRDARAHPDPSPYPQANSPAPPPSTRPGEQ